MTLYPKTHSKILWHFTGGPKWSKERNCQERNPKPIADAYDILLKILESKAIRIGGFHEVIKVRIARERYYDFKAKKVLTRRNQTKQLSTSPVCCVADIPLSELFYHAKRYGKIAIGFHRKAITDHGFNPVLYTPVNGEIVHHFYQAQRALDLMDDGDIASEVESLKDEVEGQLSDIEDVDLDIDTGSVEFAAQSLVEEAQGALEHLEESLAYTKTYTSREFEKIYAEREWRSVAPFEFSMKDVAMILLPSKGSIDCFEKFTSNDHRSLDLPRSVSVVRWEDVIEG